MSGFDSIDRAIADVAAGRPVIVVDDEDREHEGDLIVAAEMATPELLAFMVRMTSGYVCVALQEGDCARMGLVPQHHQNEDRHGTAYLVTVDARLGVTTGISAADRSATARLLASPYSVPADFTRPGHVVPLRARPGGVLERPGHTEASVDLARLAGLRPAGVLCEIVSSDEPTGMARGQELMDIASEHGLAIVTIADLIAHRRRQESQVERLAEARMPTSAGAFTAVGYRDRISGMDHVAFVHGDVAGQDEVLVRVHSACLTGDVFGSLRCDCGPQLLRATTAISREGAGIVVYLRDHEGRGVGLAHKLRAYQLQDGGADTVEANLALGLPADAREYAVAAWILADLDVRSVRLLTNNDDKRAGLVRCGIPVVRMVPLVVDPIPENIGYLRVKRDKLGHMLPALERASGPVAGWWWPW